MCYSAMVWADYRKYVKRFHSKLSILDFVELFRRAPMATRCPFPRAWKPHLPTPTTKMNAAEVYRHTMVESLEHRADGTWTVNTNKGTIHAEHVVNAGGLWAREVGRMVGIELPVLAFEHMYLLTDDMPEIVEYREKHGKELPMSVDFAGESYFRQEGDSMLLGSYEYNCVPWSPKQTPWLRHRDFGRGAPQDVWGRRHAGRAGRRLPHPSDSGARLHAAGRAPELVGSGSGAAFPPPLGDLGTRADRRPRPGAGPKSLIPAIRRPPGCELYGRASA